MYKKVLFLLSIILLFLIIPIAVGDKSEIHENDNANTIHLKAGPIHTDAVPAAANERREVPTASVASYSIEQTGNNDSQERYYIVQFKGPVLEEWKDELAGTGAVLFDYIPNNAFVIRMDTLQKEQVDSLDFVKWTGEYKASYKHRLDTGNGENIPISSSAQENVDIVVLLFDGSDKQKIAEEITSQDAEVMESSGNVLRVRIAMDKIENIASIEGVSWLEEYTEPVISNDIAAGIIGVSPVYNNYSLNGTGQIVAVCDTGLDTGVNNASMHADIRGRILDISDYLNDGAGDQSGHGTHVAGSVLGSGLLSDGKYKGMAPGARLVFQAIGTNKGELTGVPADLSVLFQKAYEKGARIHTNSWGYTYDIGKYTMYASQVDSFMWEHPDMLILFSAGNQGVDLNKIDGVVDQNSITHPGTAKNCLTVGASESYRPALSTIYGNQWTFSINPIYSDRTANNPAGIVALSGRGPTDDGRIKPDLIAPGTQILSVRSSLSPGAGYYTYMSGTSMATPITAGAAALVRQYYMDIEGLPGPSAALIKATLINGAQDMTPGQYGTGITQEIKGWPDNSQGWGRVDVESSLFPEYPEVIAYSDNYNKAGLTTSQSWNRDYNYIKEGETVKATLVWTDHPGSPASAVMLVNNLDLKVTGPAATYYGNGKLDALNNVEAVRIGNASPGNYRFDVTGKNVPNGPQGFALVLSFTCENNEFPAGSSSTTDSMTPVAVDIVHPAGVNKNSIRMEINGNPVPFTAVDISGGYRIRYTTPTPYQSGKYNVHATALTAKGKAFSYGWDFNVKPVITSFRVAGLDPVVSGIINEEAKTISMVVPYGTSVKALIPTIVHNGLSISPATDIVQDFTNPVTYTVTSADRTAQKYTVTAATAANPAKSITSFKFAGLDPAVAGVVSEISKTVTLKVPLGTDITSLVPTIEHTGMSISPGTGVEQNFKSPVTYTVTAADGTTQKYTVTVTTVENSARSITGFRFTELDPVVTGVINERSRTVSLKVPYGTNITALVPAIEHTGAGISPETGVAQNFTKPVSYTVRAPDGTTQGYTVTVSVASSTENLPVPTSTGGGGGGGGGGGSTGERTENIELKDVSSIFVGRDLVRFDFKNPANDIQYIEYISLKNSGTITATIEMLKDRSYLASSSPEGPVYRHVNIWLGKSGYATEANIMDPVIVFRVDTQWMDDYNIDPASVVLNRYSDGAWSELPTKHTGSDENYLYFETETSGFSPFAITGKNLLNESALHSAPDTMFSTSSDDDVIDAVDPIDTKVNETQPEKTLPALSATITLLIVSFVCFLIRKQ